MSLILSEGNMFTFFLWLMISDKSFFKDVTASQKILEMNKNEAFFGKTFLAIFMAPFAIALDIAIWPITILVIIYIIFEGLFK